MEALFELELEEEDFLPPEGLEEEIPGVSAREVRGLLQTLEEIAREMKMRPQEVRELLRASKKPVSLEMPIGDEDSHLADLIEDKQAASPVQAVIEKDMARQIDRALATLSPKEERVIRMRFGIGEPSEYTLEEIGNVLEVSRERIRQIELLALEKLRHPARRKLLETRNEMPFSG